MSADAGENPFDPLCVCGHTLYEHRITDDEGGLYCDDPTCCKGFQRA